MEVVPRARPYIGKCCQLTELGNQKIVDIAKRYLKARHQHTFVPVALKSRYKLFLIVPQRPSSHHFFSSFHYFDSS